MSESTVDAWIEKLAEARKTAMRFSPGDAGPKTRQDAYRIQQGVVHALGPVAGFKTARQGSAPPIMAPIFAADTITSGDEAEVGDLLGVELEIGFRIVRDLPGDMAKMTAAQLIPYLKPVVVIELVDTRLAGHLAEDPVSKLADNQINAGLVIGETAEKWDGTDFGDVEARMQAGDDQLITGMASVPGGSALETVAALARQIGTHCGGLQKGQIVITGSLHPLTYYPAGTEVLGSIQSIGSVGVSLNGPPKKAA